MKKISFTLFAFLILSVLAGSAFCGSISITNPAGGQSYCRFTQQMIKWQKTGRMAGTVSIFLMHPNGQSIKRTIAMSAPNTGKYLWDGGASTPGNYFIRVRVSPTAQYPNPTSGQTDIFTITDCEKPDLQVGFIKITPQNPGEGQTVTYKGNVMNYGKTAAVNPYVKLKVTRPGGLSSLFFGKQLNVTLQKNQGVTFVQQFKVPKQGSYTCIFTLDPADKISELNENNNTKNWTFGVHALPDLMVCIDNGKRPPVGRKRDIKAVVTNIGNHHTSANHKIRLRFQVEGKGTNTYDIPPLNSGQSHTITRRHSWGTSGTKTITAQVLYSGNEINTGNNQVTGSYFVRLPHHNKYGAAFKVKCSTSKNFYGWDDCENQY